MCVGLLNLHPREHTGLQVGHGLPEGLLWNEPVVIITVRVASTVAGGLREGTLKTYGPLKRRNDVTKDCGAKGLRG